MVARMIIQASRSSADAAATGWCPPAAGSSVPERGEEPADDPDPVPPEVDQQRDRGGHVQADDERQVRRLGRGHVRDRCAQLPPIRAGISTLCPRLDTGNSSVTPWTGRPRRPPGRSGDHARPFAMLRCRIIVRLARGAGGGGAGQDPAGKRPRSRRTARTNFYKTVEHYQVRGGGRADTGSRGSGGQRRQEASRAERRREVRPWAGRGRTASGRRPPIPRAGRVRPGPSPGGSRGSPRAGRGAGPRTTAGPRTSSRCRRCG